MARTWVSVNGLSLDRYCALVTTTLGCDSATMARSKLSGESSGIGMNAAPAFRVPRLATMYSEQVSMNMPTGSSGEAP